MATDYLSGPVSQTGATPALPPLLPQSSSSSLSSSLQSVSLPVLHRDASTITLLVDAEFFELNPQFHKNPSEWPPDAIRIMCPENFSNVRLFMLPLTRQQASPQIVAAQFDICDYDAVSGTRLLQARLVEWLEEFSNRLSASTLTYDRRTGRTIQRTVQSRDPFSRAPLVPVADTSASLLCNNNHGPTLFSLLARLADSSITTVEQRHAIRRIITDYLNNDISHGKVFSYLGQVVGYQTLDTIIRSLSTKQLNGIQQTQTTTQLEHDYCLNLPLNDSTSGPLTQSTQFKTYPTQQQIFTPELLPHQHEEVSNDTTRYQKAFFLKTFIKPMRWIQPDLPDSMLNATWGQRLVVLDNRAFLLGGLQERQSLSPNNEQPILLPTFQSLRVIQLRDLSIKDVTTNGFECCPPSLSGHFSHLSSFASGPMTLVHGGYTLLPSSFSSLDAKYSTELLIQLNTQLYGLDMLSKRWIIIDEKTNRRPPPRHSHSAAVIPSNTDIITGTSAAYAEYLIIFGGIGQHSISSHNSTIISNHLYISDDHHTTHDEPNKDSCTTPTSSLISVHVDELIPLNDLWVFSFMSGTWNFIDLQPSPSSRFGASFFWMSSSTLLLYGGEGRLPIMQHQSKSHSPLQQHPIVFGTPNGSRTILSDSWLLSYEKKQTQHETDEDDLQLHWEESLVASGPPRAHYAPVSLTACIPPYDQHQLDHLSISQTTPYPTFSPLWASSSSSSSSSLIHNQQSGWITQRVLFLISGTTKDADGNIYETPSIVIGLILQKKNSLLQHLSIIWRLLDTIRPISGHIGPSFCGRRGHSAIFFDALARLPSEALIQEQLKQYTLKLKPKKKSHPMNVTHHVSHNQSTHDVDVFYSQSSQIHHGDNHITTTSFPYNQMTHNDDNDDNTSHLCYSNQQTILKNVSHITTSVPCILIYGGMDGKGHVLPSHLWVLKLSPLQPRFQSVSISPSIEKNIITGLILSGIQCTPSLTRLYDLEEEDDTLLHDIDPQSLLMATKTQQFASGRPSRIQLQQTQHHHPLGLFKSNDLNIMKQVWTDPSKNYQPLLYQTGHTISSHLIWSLATLLKHPFSPFGHLLENAVERHIKSEHISICFEIWKHTECITITDNGIGLSHKNLHLLLKSFGHQSDALFTTESSHFGLGFKLATGRLSHNVLVLTKTTVAYGVGLFSVPLNTLFGISNFSCPIVFWSASDGYPVALPLEEAEFGQSLGLILQHSPIGTSTELEHEFEQFGSATGTRFIFFGLRKDLPYPYITSDHRVSFTSFRESSLLSLPKPHVSNSLGPDHMTSSAGETMSDEQLHNNETLLIKQTSPSPQQHGMILPGNLSGFHIQLLQTVELPTMFPLYSCAKDSLDYNLATYLFWLHLHAAPQLYLNGIHLIPTPDQNNRHDSGQDTTDISLKCLKSAGIELPLHDTYQHSLWRFLQHRLYYKLELPFLFQPKFGDDHFYGMIGFLNDPLQLHTTSTSLVVCETGRLINRAMLPMPAIPDWFEPPSNPFTPIEKKDILTSFSLTAVINVPDFFLPRATKEEFICSSDLAMHDFYDQLEKVIVEYLNVYKDPNQLNQLQQRYIKEFDEFRELCWNEHSTRPTVTGVLGDDHASPINHSRPCSFSVSRNNHSYKQRGVDDDTDSSDTTAARPVNCRLFVNEQFGDDQNDPLINSVGKKRRQVAAISSRDDLLIDGTLTDTTTLSGSSKGGHVTRTKRRKGELKSVHLCEDEKWDEDTIGEQRGSIGRRQRRRAAVEADQKRLGFSDDDNYNDFNGFNEISQEIHVDPHQISNSE